MLQSWYSSEYDIVDIVVDGVVVEIASELFGANFDWMLQLFLLLNIDDGVVFNDDIGAEEDEKSFMSFVLNNNDEFDDNK